MNSLNSCLYRGTVTHRRQTPVEHEFRYRLFWLYLDLDEWQQTKRRVTGLSDRLLAPASFHRSDHLGDTSMSLRNSVQQFVRDQSREDLATGPIRLLTQPRSFGFYFSPLNLYYCFDESEQLSAVVAEVNNTPWGEQHCYLLWRGNQTDGGPASRYVHPKTFHVSPFMDMDQQYHWHVETPADTLVVGLSARHDGQTFFDAGMHLERMPLTSWSLATNLARSPISAARVLLAIYYQALRLWMKRCPYYPHPKTKSNSVPTA